MPIQLLDRPEGTLATPQRPGEQIASLLSGVIQGGMKSNQDRSIRRAAATMLGVPEDQVPLGMFKQEDLVDLQKEKYKSSLDPEKKLFETILGGMNQTPTTLGVNAGVASPNDIASPSAGISNAVGLDQGKLLRGMLSKKFGVPYEQMMTPEEKAQALEEKVKEKDLLKIPTAGEESNAIYAKRVEQAERVFSKLEGELSHLGLGASIMQTKGPFGIGVPNWLKTSDAQSYQQAKRNFLNSILRKESGAVISPSEFTEGNQQYFPQPGDKPEVIAQKKENRRVAIEGLKQASGKAYIEDKPLPNDPLGIR